MRLNKLTKNAGEINGRNRVGRGPGCGRVKGGGRGVNAQNHAQVWQ